MVEYEFRELHFNRDATPGQIRQMLADFAEYEHWELARTRLYTGGRRRIWLRRKIIRVMRTA
ncbi:DUF5703 family protein [Branchiibius cervicis]|uniref:DUF5703 family protein n=1 Tax=Branchiibius cervicis TaxID=908252 RepID=A0ABW2ARV2_9MICO